MKIETRDLEDRQVEMKVEVPAEDVQKAMHTAARKLSKQTKIPGFRPGKAPYEIVVGKFGEAVVFEEALDSLGQEAYRSGLEDSELEPYAPGMLEEVVSRDPLILRYSVPLAPEVDLGDYHSLRAPFEAAQVTDEALEDAMQELLQRQALIEPADRPAQDSDLVILDVFGELLESEAEDKRLIDSKGASVLVDPETDFPVPGVYQYLKGIAAGDERTFEYTFPEDYTAEDLQGKAAKFKLTCSEVKSRLVPEWSDDLAQNMGDFETLLDLRVKLRQSLQSQAEQEKQTEYADQVIELLVEQATVVYPPVVLEEELARTLRDLEGRLKGQKMTMEDYLKVEGKTQAELQGELEPTARERIKRGLVLGKIVELEKLDIDDDEVQAEIDRMMEPFEGNEGQELRKVFENATSRNRIALDLLTNKAVTRLTNLARGITEEAVEAKAEDESAGETESQPASELEAEIETGQEPEPTSSSEAAEEDIEKE
ncbi:MAG: trigger factor [Anaerolineales bacterium]|nr:MAG: trigger factor [Anaerolineales bacterium]